MADRRGFRWVAVAAGCAVAVVAPFAAAGARDGTPTTTGRVVTGSGTPVPDHWIVLLKDRTAAPATVAGQARTLSDRYAGAVRFVYTAGPRGFAVRMTAARAARLATDPLVASVEQDTVVRTAQTQSPAPWGLDRVDQRGRPLDNSYTYASTAAGVRAYVIDTGIRTTHTDFGGRASVGLDTVGDGRAGQDCNGHGTHVAGTLGGTTYGVAKGVSLVAVRVLDCEGVGYASDVIAGISWVTANAVKPAVANMSLGAAFPDSALDQAVAASIASGVTYTLAAGNDDRDACGTSPARVPAGITVGSSTSADRRAPGTNYGTCLDLFAPGEDVTSDWHTGPADTNTVSGTSMAAPHAAGAAALHLAEHPAATPADVRAALVARATTGALGDLGTGSPDRLLHTGPGGDQPTGTNPPTTTPAPTTTPPRGFPTRTPTAAPTTTSPRGFPTRTQTPTTTPTTPTGTPTGTPTTPTTTPPRGFPTRTPAPPVPTAPGPVSDAVLPIPDRGTAVSAVTLPPRTGFTTVELRVSMTIRHTYRGDLAVDLTGPSGTPYRLATPDVRDGRTDLVETFTVRVPAARVGGVWTLTVRDTYDGDSGVLEGWSIAQR